mmetsp:Transcript_12080/g.21694  ORF Transcript_12080/g.21694 Transcript_12080/m.21694 type:complete len:248 (-) Transcript_12080:260-1003(-)
MTLVHGQHVVEATQQQRLVEEVIGSPRDIHQYARFVAVRTVAIVIGIRGKVPRDRPVIIIPTGKNAGRFLGGLGGHGGRLQRLRLLQLRLPEHLVEGKAVLHLGLRIAGRRSARSRALRSGECRGDVYGGRLEFLVGGHAARGRLTRRSFRRRRWLGRGVVGCGGIGGIVVDGVEGQLLEVILLLLEDLFFFIIVALHVVVVERRELPQLLIAQVAYVMCSIPRRRRPCQIRHYGSGRGHIVFYGVV